MNIYSISNTIILLLVTSGIACTNDTLKDESSKPRVLVSTDIGGTDPDDFQSFIHLLMYANEVQIEGLVSSPYGPGRKEDFYPILDIYESEYEKFLDHDLNFPDAQELRLLCKQGATELAPFKGYREATEGSKWIINCAKRQHTDEPLWVLVWGGLEDVAQALHDAPEITKKIKVYWIGGPNKKWGANAYDYIAGNHPDLWMIEANATYRGWFMDDDDTPEEYESSNFYHRFIEGNGPLAVDFKNYYEGQIKMGDTPSLAYILNGKPEEPTRESWGGQFEKIKYSSKRVFYNSSSVTDTIPAYGIIEWRFDGPVMNIHQDSVCFTAEIQGQTWPGYYIGDGVYSIRYSSKKPETGHYKISSNINALNGLQGAYTSVIPWPGIKHSDDYLIGEQWYTDISDPKFFIAEQQGAKTVSKHKKDFMNDWAQRWAWFTKP